jgi:hypothetical protein
VAASDLHIGVSLLEGCGFVDVQLYARSPNHI